MLTNEFDVEIRAFDPARHVRAGFDCRVKRLNNYLQKTAKKHQASDFVKVFVAVRPGDFTVLGYHAINVGHMNVDVMPKRPRDIPSHGEVPVLFLGQIAVSKSAQRMGIGSILMHHVFQKAQVVSESAGCHAIILDVMSDGGEEEFQKRKNWYASYGFQETVSNSARMFMTMKQVRDLI